MRSKDKSFYRLLILDFVFSLLIVAILMLLKGYNIPVMIDEIGYYENMAAIFGDGWENACKYIAYYSFMPMLVYLPLRFFTSDYVLIHKLVKIENIFIIILLYFLLCKVITKITGNSNIVLKKLIAFSLSISPILISASKFVGAELGNVVLFLLLILCLLRWEERKDVKNVILSGLCSMGLLMTHNRNIAIFIIVFAYFFISSVKKKKKIAFMAVVLMLLELFTYYASKSYIQQLTGLGMIRVGNSISDQGEKAIFLLDNLVLVAESFVTKLWTSIVVYCGFLIIGCIWLYRIGKSHVSYSRTCKVILCCFICTFLINVCYLVDIPSRVDTYFYIRYSEFTMIPIVGIGAAKTIEERDVRGGLLCALIISICSFISFNIFSDIEENSRMLSICIPESFLIVKNNFFYLATKIILIFTLVMIVVHKDIRKYSVMCMMLIMCTGGIKSFVQSRDFYYSNSVSEKIKSGYIEEIDYIKDNKYKNILLLTNGGWEENYNSAFLQFLVNDVSFDVEYEKDFCNKKNEYDAIMVPIQFYNEYEYRNDYRLVYKTSDFCFYEN